MNVPVVTESLYNIYEADHRKQVTPKSVSKSRKQRKRKSIFNISLPKNKSDFVPVFHQQPRLSNPPSKLPNTVKKTSDLREVATTKANWDSVKFPKNVGLEYANPVRISDGVTKKNALMATAGQEPFIVKKDAEKAAANKAAANKAAANKAAAKKDAAEKAAKQAAAKKDAAERAAEMAAKQAAAKKDAAEKAAEMAAKQAAAEKAAAKQAAAEKAAAEKAAAEKAAAETAAKKAATKKAAANKAAEMVAKKAAETAAKQAAAEKAAEMVAKKAAETAAKQAAAEREAAETAAKKAAETAAKKAAAEKAAAETAAKKAAETAAKKAAAVKAAAQTAAKKAAETADKKAAAEKAAKQAAANKAAANKAAAETAAKKAAAETAAKKAAETAANKAAVEKAAEKAAKQAAANKAAAEKAVANKAAAEKAVANKAAANKAAAKDVAADREAAAASSSVIQGNIPMGTEKSPRMDEVTPPMQPFIVNEVNELNEFDAKYAREFKIRRSSLLNKKKKNAAAEREAAKKTAVNKVAAKRAAAKKAALRKAAAKKAAAEREAAEKEAAKKAEAARKAEVAKKAEAAKKAVAEREAATKKTGAERLKRKCTSSPESRPKRPKLGYFSGSTSSLQKNNSIRKSDTEGLRRKDRKKGERMRARKRRSQNKQEKTVATLPPVIQGNGPILLTSNRAPMAEMIALQRRPSQITLETPAPEQPYLANAGEHAKAIENPKTQLKINFRKKNRNPEQLKNPRNPEQLKNLFIFGNPQQQWPATGRQSTAHNRNTAAKILQRAARRREGRSVFKKENLPFDVLTREFIHPSKAIQIKEDYYDPIILLDYLRHKSREGLPLLSLHTGQPFTKANIDKIRARVRANLEAEKKNKLATLYRRQKFEELADDDKLKRRRYPGKKFREERNAVVKLQTAAKTKQRYRKSVQSEQVRQETERQAKENKEMREKEKKEKQRYQESKLINLKGTFKSLLGRAASLLGRMKQS